MDRNSQNPNLCRVVYWSSASSRQISVGRGLLHATDARTMCLGSKFWNLRLGCRASVIYFHGYVNLGRYILRRVRRHCFAHFLCPQLRKSWRGVLVSGCASVRASVRSSHACHILWTMHARVLKFHIWIIHGTIADTRFFFLSELSPFLELCPFAKNKNEIWCMPYLMNRAC